MNDISTANRILDVAQTLIQTKGYNAISFTDIAELVGIKKPSIVHHFPNKAALGEAVVRRYSDVFSENLNAIIFSGSHNSLQAFRAYCEPYQHFSKLDDYVCLCGALAGEYLALPKNVQSAVTSFFDMNVDILQKIIAKGKASGEFNCESTPKSLAMHIVSALQGALIIKRATGNIRYLSIAIAQIESQLGIVEGG